ncbi:hypothetical protein HOP50_02g15870 [Chloropicon primus]|uniref:Transmembrane protein n=1 Tax=Chloropicon primus TaxID=1764295 RepID=A0A5B8MEN1_9CHLO|nr:hypothetical protein A3770_02p15960 [Chloropicon primus]UPQ98287.1 hypothetical protein HOP50_02g15870 [Chloropicon primus]|eukprot:QDZ19078.1 hypothetical protein A3770_02p15960 [Chloropicon primus]
MKGTTGAKKVEMGRMSGEACENDSLRGFGEEGLTGLDDLDSPVQYDDIATSGQDMPGISSPSKYMFSPSQKMRQKLGTQQPNQLYKYSRLWVQVCIPACILLCAGLFLWSNLSIAATVMVNITIPQTSENIIEFTGSIPPRGAESLASEALNASQSLQLPPGEDWIPLSRVATMCIFTSQPMRCMGEAIVQSISKSVNKSGLAVDSSYTDNSVQFPIFNFSMPNAVNLMWNGHAYALAVLIAFLSGGWPYIKLAAMFVLWFVPVRPSLRETLLALLEALGKWSMIDVYVFALMMAGFRFNLNVGAIAVIKIGIQAKWGIFSFCIAVIWSHLLSHIMMFVHHNAQSKFMKLPQSEKHFALSAVARFRHRKLNTCGQFMVVLLILAALGFTVASLIIPSFKFEFFGLLGMLLPPQDQVSENSLVTAGTYIPSILDGLPLHNKVGEWFVVVVYYAFSFVTPILKVVSCLLLWTMPFTTHQKEVAKGITGILGTWSALDVFFVSVIAAMLEIGNVTSSMMGDSCEALKTSLGVECLRLEAGLLPGIWLMLVAVVMSFIASRVVLSSTTAHFRRVSMLHLWALKKEYLEKIQEPSGKGNETEEELRAGKEITLREEELFRPTFSSKLANLLAGSFHESHVDLSALSPDQSMPS